MAFKLLPLTAEERAFFGFTHKVRILFSDLPAGTTATDLQIFPRTGTFPAGTVVTRVGAAIVTNFAGGSVSALTAIIADVTLGTSYIGAFSIWGAATPIPYKITQTPIAYVAADALKVTFTPTTANMNTITSGALDVFFSLLSLTDGAVPAA